MLVVVTLGAPVDFFESYMQVIYDIDKGTQDGEREQRH